MDRTLYRGDTWRFLDTVYQDVTTQVLFTVPVTNPPTPPPADAVPFNLTGCRIWVTVKNLVQDPDQRAVMELDNQALGGVTVTTPAAGAFTVVGPAIATIGSADSPVPLVFDIQIKTTDGSIFTIEAGTLTVIPDVTRAIA